MTGSFAGSYPVAEILKNLATHVGFSGQAFSDAGSTPAASTTSFHDRFMPSFIKPTREAGLKRSQLPRLRHFKAKPWRHSVSICMNLLKTMIDSGVGGVAHAKR